MSIPDNDYLVTFLVPLTMRVENVDHWTTAEDIAQDALVDANLPMLVDLTPFYVGTEFLQGDRVETHTLIDHSLATKVVIRED